MTGTAGRDALGRVAGDGRRDAGGRCRTASAGGRISPRAFRITERRRTRLAAHV